MSNIHGLHSTKRKSSDDEGDDDDDKVNHYVGGVDSRGGGSGLAVEPNPDLAGSANSDNILDNVRARATSGGGSSSEGKPRRTITMYRDGFTVDDGPYRRVDDPNNSEFLSALARGRTPRELAEDENGNTMDVIVGLVDKRTEDYEEPERRFQSFSGAGSALGSASAGGGGSSDGIFTPGGSSAGAPEKLDGSKPSTSIQIRLLVGKRLVVKVNLDDSVSVLGRHIEASGNGGDDPYVLVSGFPPKPITDLGQTIGDAGLKGAQVTQKKA